MNVQRSVLDASCGDRWVISASRLPWSSLSADILLIRKGLIWLLFATIAEVPPVVSGSITCPFFQLIVGLCGRCSSV